MMSRWVTEAWDNINTDEAYPNILRTGKRQSHVCTDNSTHRRLSAVMHEVHPPLQGDSSLLPQPLYCIS